MNEIPENIIYSILPILRWQIGKTGEYKSTTVAQSIKVTRGTSQELLAESITISIQEAI